jgi:hypothetical protein
MTALICTPTTESKFVFNVCLIFSHHIKPTALRTKLKRYEKNETGNSSRLYYCTLLVLKAQYPVFSVDKL